MNVVIDDAALDDLAAIYVWIGDRSPDSAASVLNQIFEAIERLGRMPHIGHEGRVKDTFEWVVSAYSYVIVYEIDRKNDRLIVIGVFRGAQEVRRP
jgi:plasmid stabilization system protein ParE